MATFQIISAIFVDFSVFFKVNFRVFLGDRSAFWANFGYLVGLVSKCDTFMGQTRHGARRASPDSVVEQP